MSSDSKPETRSLIIWALAKGRGWFYGQITNPAKANPSIIRPLSIKRESFDHQVLSLGSDCFIIIPVRRTSSQGKSGPPSSGSRHPHRRLLFDVSAAERQEVGSFACYEPSRQSSVVSSCLLWPLFGADSTPVGGSTKLMLSLPPSPSPPTLVILTCSLPE